MKKLMFICVALMIVSGTYAQHALKLVIKSAETKSPLSGATAIITSINKTAIADSSGITIFDAIAAGTYRIRISYVGFQEQELSISVPQPAGSGTEIFLKESGEEEEEVIITSTRTSRSINDIPTRVETISGEELTEKGNMKPGDIRMMLNESTGIQTQQTSATSYNSSIRIQGLDGRYTQLLRDGLPLYAGFAGGLSLMQVAPLDLNQVEVIKGSSSTLYGGGAIAGLVNLISKTPKEKREINFLANATSAKGLDVSGFYSQRFKNTGVTIFGSRNTASPYDPADIGLTSIPKFERYTLNPRFFVYGGKTNANVGLTYITENRIGGSIGYIKHGTTGYFEKNNSDRLTAQVDVQHRLGINSNLNFKSSYTQFNRQITIPTHTFEGRQQSSFSELNVNIQGTKSFWIAGFNFLTDDFKETQHQTIALRTYHYNTPGVFVQNTWSPIDKVTLETGVRVDHVQQYGFEILPRVSAMFKITSKITARVGGGLGYKTPTVFNEEAEQIQFRNILPINQHKARTERSTGGNLDFNYRTSLGELGFTMNQLFFYTRLQKPLVLVAITGTDLEFENAAGHIETKGIETNLRFTYGDFKLFVGYTYADVNSYFNDIKKWFPLTARHRLNNVLMYEQEEKWKVGLEAYYFSRQQLKDGTTGRSYWICGLMAERLWEKFSLFINFENFTDTRQTKFGPIYTGSINDPVFKDIYAPVDGFVVNGGFKLRL